VRRWLLIPAGVLVIVALVAVVLVSLKKDDRPMSATGRPTVAGLTPPSTGRQRQNLLVAADSPFAKSARTVEVGTLAYDLHDGKADVVISTGAAGLSTVKDAQGKVVGSAPLWSIPGGAAEVVPVSCASTGFVGFLSTPGISTSNPIEVGLLWEAANQPEAAPALKRLGDLSCKRLASHGEISAEEMKAALQLAEKISQVLTPVAAQLAPTSESLAILRGAAVEGGEAPGTDVTSAGALSGLGRTQLVASEEETCQQVEPSEQAHPSLKLCANGKELKVENASASWAFLYPAGSDRASEPIALIPGRRASAPSVGRIAAAIAAYLAKKAVGAGCHVASWVHLCKPGKTPSTQEIQDLFHLSENGEAEVSSANGYFSLAWGNNRGDRSSFVGTPNGDYVTASKNISFIAGAVLPMIALIVDQAPERDLPPEQLRDFVEVFVEAGDKMAETPFSAEDPVEQLKTVLGFVKDFFADPDVIYAVAVLWFPRLDAKGFVRTAAKALAEKIAEDFAPLLVPVAGWIVTAAELAIQGPAVLNVISADALLMEIPAQESYSSWPATLDAKLAAALRRTPFQSEGFSSCPRQQGTYRVPGAPSKLECEWVVDLRLNDNKSLDRLVLWATESRRGAVGFVDGGTIAEIRTGPRRTELDAQDDWDNLGSDDTETLTPNRVTSLATSQRQALLTTFYVGGRGSLTAALILDSSENLRWMSPSGSSDLIWTTSTDRTDFGCATQSGQRLFVESYAGTGAALSVDDPHADLIGISRSYERLATDGRVTYVGSANQVVKRTDPAASSSPYANDCTGPLPAAQPTRAPAKTPQAAVKTMLLAARDSDTAAQLATSAGTGAAFDPNLSQYEPDVFGYLTKTEGVDARSWIGRPVSCADLDGYELTCEASTADGYFLETLVTGSKQEGYRVAGVYAE